MNDISKTNIKTKLEKAMEAEGLKPSETARIFGIHPNYISMIRNPDTWTKCPASAWETVLIWVNSGQGLNEWSEKHGKFSPNKYEPKPVVISKVVKVEPAKEVVKKEPAKEVKQGPKRATKGELLDMLIEEKALLQQKIDAIDVLLKHYISV
jgi:hypothetical protein